MTQKVRTFRQLTINASADNYDRTSAIAFMRQQCGVGSAVGGIIIASKAIDTAISGVYTLPSPITVPLCDIPSWVTPLDRSSDFEEIAHADPSELNLVDILAREMKYWPTSGSRVDFISQSRDGKLQYWVASLAVTHSENREDNFTLVGTSRRHFPLGKDQVGSINDNTLVMRSDWRRAIQRAEQERIAATEALVQQEIEDAIAASDTQEELDAENPTILFDRTIKQIMTIREIDAELEQAHNEYITRQTVLSQRRREAEAKLNETQKDLDFLGITVTVK